MLAITAPVMAEVAQSSDQGFAISHERVVAADPETLWAALVAPARWWSAEHSWSGDAANFYLVAQAGGCFCELLRSDGAANIRDAAGSVEHMRVLYAQRGKLLRMRGALGPLQSEAVNGVLTITLTPEGEQTRITMVYKVGGYWPYPAADIAPAVDGVLGQQFDRLAALFAGAEATPDAAALPSE
jgi:uncharacterized protein YndB with AHSA1/START domain